jgi:hypothetical protein
MTRAQKLLAAAAIGFVGAFALDAFQGWEKPWTGAGDWLTLLGSGVSGAVVALVAVAILTRRKSRGD